MMHDTRDTLADVRKKKGFYDPSPCTQDSEETQNEGVSMPMLSLLAPHE